MIKLLKAEAGYSLMEVLVSIIILSIAIIPMVGMFDMGLKSASTSSNYDRARSLANLKLETARSLPYDDPINSAQDLRDIFPYAVDSADAPTLYDGSGYYESAYVDAGTELGADFAGLEYKVEKQFLAQPDPIATSQGFANSATDEDLLNVSITVQWGSGSTFSTTGMVSE